MYRKIIHFDQKAIAKFTSIEERDNFIVQFHNELSRLRKCAGADSEKSWESIDAVLNRGIRYSAKQLHELQRKKEFLELVENIIKKLFRHEHTKDNDLHSAVELYQRLNTLYPDFMKQYALNDAGQP